MPLHPSTLKKIQRFKNIRRGYYSLWIMIGFIVFCCFAELFVNHRALVVKYEGKYYFPTYRSPIFGTELGEDFPYEVNYRELKAKWATMTEDSTQHADNFILMPLIHFNPYENNFYDLKNKEGKKLAPPYPPNFKHGHYLGTDRNGRDVLARLVYAARTALFFSLLLSLITVAIGSSIGLCMGYFGGLFDLLFDRFLEIWASIPGLFVLIIISSIIMPSITVLFFIFLIMNWGTGLSVMRSITFKEKTREYILSARAQGASHLRILFKYLLPNNLFLIITALPFLIQANLTTLTAIDYLGFGLPPPTPSIGEIISQGRVYWNKPWILGSVVVLLVFLLVTITFIGESLREATDPKRYSYFE